jgi:hypothetical protein
MKTFCTITLVCLLLLCLTTANAQIDQNNLISTTATGPTSTNYFFARANEITIVVSVMGFVQRPGRYEISNSIDLVNLISLAGGPTADGSMSKVRIIRMLRNGENTARQDIQPDHRTLSSFLKDETKMTRREIQCDLENLSTARPEDLQLLPGDIIYVDRTTWSTVRDVFGVVATAVLVTSAITQIINYSHRTN